jgi:hypothetical protein
MNIQFATQPPIFTYKINCYKLPEQRRTAVRNRNAIFLTGMIGFVAIFGGCDNGTNPTPQPEPQIKNCTCPTGTVHPFGTPMPCCDADAGKCGCTVVQIPTFDEIFYYNEYAVITESMKSDIQAVFASLSPEYLVDLKNNYSPIEITRAPNGETNEDPDSIVYLDLGITVLMITGDPVPFAEKFRAALDAVKGIAKASPLHSNNKQFLALGKQLNDAKNTVRLSMGKAVLPQKQA